MQKGLETPVLGCEWVERGLGGGGGVLNRDKEREIKTEREPIDMMTYYKYTADASTKE